MRGMITDEQKRLIEQRYDVKIEFDNGYFHHSENTVYITKELVLSVILHLMYEEFEHSMFFTPDTFDDMTMEELEQEIPTIHKIIKEHWGLELTYDWNIPNKIFVWPKMRASVIIDTLNLTKENFAYGRLTNLIEKPKDWDKRFDPKEPTWENW